MLNLTVQALEALPDSAISAARDSTGMGAGHYAALHGHLDVLRMLKTRGLYSADARDMKGCTPLLCAATGGHLPVVQWLLSPAGGASVNERDTRGNTALLLAAANNHLPVVQWLLSPAGGANIDEQNTHGRTALMLADQRNYGNAVEWLLMAGATDKTASDSYPPFSCKE